MTERCRSRVFRCHGPCWDRECDCRLYENQDVPPAPMPPLHDGCVCVVVEEVEFDWKEDE